MRPIHHSKVFRTFVSSTFDDLVDERDALQAHVFPKLRQICAKRGYEFQAIDLRWGVTAEAGRDHKTMAICLAELAKCQKTTPRPNLLILLGDRYGWIPPPRTILAREFEELVAKVPRKDRAALLRPVTNSATSGWYIKDLNAVPPEYVLREQEPTAMSSDDRRTWADTERRLLGLFGIAIERSNWLPNDPRRMKYELSATHQEIYQGLLKSDMFGHAVCLDRRIVNIDAQAEQSRFVSADLVSSSRLREMKQEIRDQLPGDAYFTYDVELKDNRLSSAHLQHMCDDAERALERMIVEQISVFNERDPLAEEIDSHATLSREAARTFTGRERVLKTIDAHLRSRTNPSVLLLSGPKGAGMSAIIATAAQRARSYCALVIVRHVGATPRSFDGDDLVDDIAEEIRRAIGGCRRDSLGDLLARASANRPIYIFIDGTHLIRDHLAQMRLCSILFLSRENVRAVMTSDSSEVASLNIPGSNQIAKKLIIGQLTSNEASHIMKAWLRDAGRTLQRRQRATLASTYAKQPTAATLREMFSIVRGWASFSPIDAKALSGDADTLVQRALLRIADRHGVVLTSHALGYLDCASMGLSEPELLDLLSADEDVMTETRALYPYAPRTPTLPTILWSRLADDLSFYLRFQEAGGMRRVRIAGSTVRDAATTVFQLGTAKHSRHRVLSAYFKRLAPTVDVDGLPRQNGWRVQQLLWNLSKTESWEELAEELADLDFFATAWRLQPQWTRAAWYSIERTTECRMASTYGDAIEFGVRRRDAATVSAIAVCMSEIGRAEAAHALLGRACEGFSSAGDQAGAAAALARRVLLNVQRRDKSESLTDMSALAMILKDPANAPASDFAKHVLTRSGATPDLLLSALVDRLSGLSEWDDPIAKLDRDAVEAFEQGDLRKAWTLRVAEIDAALETGRRRDIIESMSQLANIMLLGGQPKLAAELADTARKWSSAECDDEGVMSNYVVRIQALLEVGDFMEAEAAADAMRDAADLTQRPFDTASAAYMCALALLTTRPIHALVFARRAARLADKAMFADLQDYTGKTLADARKRCGELLPNPDDPYSQFPVAECEQPDCDHAGRFAKSRLQWIGPASPEFIGWCETCQQRCCIACARMIGGNQESFLALPTESLARAYALEIGVFPSLPACPVCTELLGVGEQEIVVHFKDGV